MVILFAKVLGNGLFISLIPAHILSTEFMVIKEINTRQESSVFKIREVSNIYIPPTSRLTAMYPKEVLPLSAAFKLEENTVICFAEHNTCPFPLTALVIAPGLEA